MEVKNKTRGKARQGGRVMTVWDHSPALLATMKNPLLRQRRGTLRIQVQ